MKYVCMYGCMCSGTREGGKGGKDKGQKLGPYIQHIHTYIHRGVSE